jgi:hypothetical protein
MTDPRLEDRWQDKDDGADAASHPSGDIRLNPVRAFGLRAAALAGMVATSGAAAALALPLVTISLEPPNTTCCTTGP